MFTKNGVVCLIICSLLGCKDGKETPTSESKSAMTIEKMCETLAEKKMSRDKYDKVRQENPDKFSEKLAKVISRCKEDNGKGVVAVRTPHGLGVTEFRRGLADYAAARNVNP